MDMQSVISVADYAESLLLECIQKGWGASDWFRRGSKFDTLELGASLSDIFSRAGSLSSKLNYRRSPS